jgi:hypothetical protein
LPKVVVTCVTVLSGVALVLFEVLPMNIDFDSSSASGSSSISYFWLGLASKNNNGRSIIIPKILQKHVIVSTSITTITRSESGSSNNSSNVFYSKSTNSSSKKIIHTSIRIEEGVFDSLQREAERQGITFNSLINKTLKNYVISEMHFEQLGFLLVSKNFLRKIFSSELDENKITEYGRELGMIAAKEYVSFFFPEVNSNTVTQFLDIWFRRFQVYRHRVEDISSINCDSNSKEKEGAGEDIITTTSRKKEDKSRLAYLEKQQQQQHQLRQRHVFTLSHDINMNFSISLKATLEGLVEPIIKSPICFREITASSITFSFEITS